MRERHRREGGREGKGKKRSWKSCISRRGEGGGGGSGGGGGGGGGGNGGGGRRKVTRKDVGEERRATEGNRKL